MTSSDRPLTRPEWLFLGLVVLGWAGFVVALGKDMSWDFRNYHWYIPYAFLHGRMGFDIAVAHHATYYNPLIDIPFFLAAEHLPSWLALGLLGAVQGANIIPLYLIARSLIRVEHNMQMAAIAALLGVTGGLNISLAGMTLYDNVMSLFALSGLALLIVRRDVLANGPLKRALAIAALAGFILGSAVGLKLPEAPYAIGFAAALAVVPGDAKRRLQRLLAGGAGGVAGVAVFAGYWFVHMAHVTGNPLFPYFNELFHSPLALTTSYRDTRFLPQDIWHVLFDPIYFALDWHAADDIPNQDMRVALAYLGILAAAGIWFFRRRAKEPLAAPDGSLILFAFWAASYASWLMVFGIYRYILTLEMLSPVAVVAAAGSFPLPRQVRLWALGALALVTLAYTRAEKVQPRAPLGDPYVQVKMPGIADPAHTMILMTGIEPLGFLVPELPPQIPVLRIDGWLIQPNDGSTLTADTRARVAGFRGDLYLIAAPDEIARAHGAVGAYGLGFTNIACADITTNLGGPYLFCPLTRNAKPAPNAKS
ncbi:MAG: hypothetical protein KGR48_01430 [Alphaproteobacteria bacterium]|nr:hypothetical protein [Alphaproteobacteria bacterium]